MWLSNTVAILVISLTAVTAAPTKERNSLDVLRTVVLPNGQVIDWVRASSQGEIATPPPKARNTGRETSSAPPLEELFVSIPADLYGPEGTVPIARKASSPWPAKRLPPQIGSDEDPANQNIKFASQSAKGQHWYSQSSTMTKNKGAAAIFSMYKPYVETNEDFSLLQLALARQEAAHADFGTAVQTLEAGWVNYPRKGSNPMLFSFFNTNGYREVGDKKGCWNRDCVGWVQVDRNIYPGIEFQLFSEIGSRQLDLDLRYHLHDGNWWLSAYGRDIGYYPASLFSQNVDPSKTLAGFADRLDAYGEVLNGGDAITTTDMGSGEFAEKGDKKAAYMRNIVYIDTSGKDKNYDALTFESDHNRYRITPRWNSGSSWNSYCYIGGPGAGGVVGG